MSSKKQVLTRPIVPNMLSCIDYASLIKQQANQGVESLGKLKKENVKKKVYSSKSNKRYKI